ncbi:DUF6414 family protein [Microbacterium sp. 22195]|uniref:DUF6414 family protein n=1 Tax=Microbacterium sp. 22195 TaxID=3453891 RepID=UPI003F873035
MSSLRSFLYLNETTLSDYVSAMEGGVRSTVDDRRRETKGLQAKAGLGPIGGSGDSSKESELTISLTDSPPAQFDRLMKLAAADPELAGWVEVIDPDTDLPDLLTGALVEIEVDIEVPTFVKMLNKSTGIINTMKSLSEMSAFLPTSTDSPAIDPEQVTLVESISGLLGDKLMIIGLPDSDDWRVAGQLLPQHTRVSVDDLEGEVRIVGKITRKIRPGERHPLLALPGSSILSREKRRELARKGPSSESDDSWVTGPAVILDILAIYR